MRISKKRFDVAIQRAIEDGKMIGNSIGYSRGKLELEEKLKIANAALTAKARDTHIDAIRAVSQAIDALAHIVAELGPMR